ncbi:prephenate dehydratase [Aristophania vespae]|uniref:prephenate dehydratase n=1 Tax=Aristophania vespae TaxID=2697033 RepID=A0A6P1NIF5_9PROT|nr:prephenate dehydratase [Aristophania vespae]QHI95442.1 prephenate dehydratase [Aristophania vespae]UMM64738.1 Bifunctional chorismate mutase/prephenate dehydratase [Aristophania vespae]
MSVIAFQGRPGAYSDLACRAARPGWRSLACRTFLETIEAVKLDQAQEGLLPCENSLAGRVPEIHTLLPESGLKIVGEHFQRVEHALLGVKGAKLSDIKRLHTHPVALGQIRNFVKDHNLEAVAEFDTAGSAELVAEWNNKEDAAVASTLAAELYDLTILQENIEDAAHNTTRFYRVSKNAQNFDYDPGFPLMTTLLIQVKNIAGALFNVLSCFNEQKINMTRLESYMLDGTFTATQFLIDVEGAPINDNLRKALSDLKNVSQELRVLGVYPRSPLRDKL